MKKIYQISWVLTIILQHFLISFCAFYAFFGTICIQITNLNTNTFETARIYSILLNIWNQPTLSHQHEMFDVSKKISAPKGNCKALYGDCWFFYKCIKNLNAGKNAIKLSINCDRNAFSIYFFTPLE